MTLNTASWFTQTKTLKISLDFFGVLSSSIQRDITASIRSTRRSGFRTMRTLLREAGLISVEDVVLFISYGVNHIGEAYALVTISCSSPLPSGDLIHGAPAPRK